MPKIPVIEESPRIQQPEEIPQGVRPFRFHGVSLEWGGGSDQALGDCPFCDKEGKFYVSLETGQWDCKSCGETGNPVTFMRRLWEVSDRKTKDYAGLAKDRGLLFPETLITWEICQSAISGRWLVPECGVDGKLCSLAKWSLGQKGKNVLFASPKVCGVGHGLFGMQLYRKESKNLWIGEGGWDPIALWETLRIAKQDEHGEVSITGSEAASLLKDGSVIGAPGALTFKDTWIPLAAGKRVFLCYDNDHSKLENGTEKGLQGLKGMKKVAGMLLGSKDPPEEINYIHWGDKGFDPSLKDGYDLRDFFAQAKTPQERVALLPQLFDKIRPIPKDWGVIRKKGDIPAGLEPLPCSSWNTLKAAYEKALEWHDGLDVGLSVVLAVIASTGFPCDQLWVQLISPASSGKGELISGPVINEKWVKEVGTFTGFHSGFQSDGSGEEDHSLIAMLKNMTFIIKEGDTLRTANNREKILAQLREAYDKFCSTAYGNKVKRDYRDHPFTSILCCTDAMLELDASELGSRYINCTILDEIPEELESQINHKKFNQIWANKGVHVNGDGKSTDTPEKVYARRLCAGYVDYLRENVEELRAALKPRPGLSDKLDRLVRFIAMMRARPAKKQNESESRELSARLMGQFTAAAIHIPIAMGKQEVDDEVMRRLVKLAMDTARGKTLDLARWLYYCIPKDGEPEGAETGSLAIWLGQDDIPTGRLLKFLASKKIRVVERFKPTMGTSRRPRWRLTDRFQELFKEVALYSTAPIR